MARAVGWGPKVLIVETPALVQGQSYHLEVEAPEGLQMTAGELGNDGSEDDRPGPRSSSRRKTQRHLYLSNVPQGMSGSAPIETAAASVHDRPGRDPLTALFTLAVLVAFAIFWKPDDPGRQNSLPGLLLVLPGILAGYVARSRELLDLRSFSASALLPSSPPSAPLRRPASSSWGRVAP